MFPVYVEVETKPCAMAKWTKYTLKVLQFFFKQNSIIVHAVHVYCICKLILFPRTGGVCEQSWLFYLVSTAVRMFR